MTLLYIVEETLKMPAKMIFSIISTSTEQNKNENY